MVVRLIVRATAATRDVISRGACTRGSGSSWQQNNQSPITVPPLSRRGQYHLELFSHLQKISCSTKLIQRYPCSHPWMFFWHATNCHDIHHFRYKAKHVIHSFSVIQFQSAFGESFPATLWPERFRKRNPGLCLTLGFPDGVDPVKRHVTLILIDLFFSKQVWGWESESQQLDIQYHRRGFEGSRCKSCLRGGWMELSSDTCSVLVYWAKPWDTHIRKLFWDWPEHWHCLQVCDVLGNDVVYCIFIDDRQR